MAQIWQRLSAVAVVIVTLPMTIGFLYRAEIARLIAAVTLFAEHKIVANFSSMGSAFHATGLPRGEGPVSPLPTGRKLVLSDDKKEWFLDRNTTSLIVVHRGRVVFEEYYLGTGPDDLRIWWSVSKSWLSVLLGIVLDEGHIVSIDEPVVQYAPSLAGSAYDGTTIRDVLTMSSGVLFDEDYFDFRSDINRMGRILAVGGSMDKFAASFTERSHPPGEEWAYVSIDTHVIGMVIRGATDRDLPDLMSEKILTPLGIEIDGYYLADSHGVAFALGGLNLRSRDQARFAAMILADGTWQGRRIVPSAWLFEATGPQAKTAAGAKRYGYQWWIPADAKAGEFQAEGIYGQHLYFDRQRDVAIVMTAADRRFREPEVAERNTKFFRQIATNVSMP